jgi:hypothetical protein
MHIEQVKRLTVAELEELLGLPGNNVVCENANCFRLSAPGYIYCLQCMHGTSAQAHPVYVAAKKRLMKLKRRAA